MANILWHHRCHSSEDDQVNQIYSNLAPVFRGVVLFNASGKRQDYVRFWLCVVPFPWAYPTLDQGARSLLGTTFCAFQEPQCDDAPAQL